MIFILALIMLNGLFALAEIAVVTAKKHKLEKLSSEGNINAKIALELSNAPTTFLSTIQVGITVVGILAGALGETSVTRQVSSAIVAYGVSMVYAEPVARLLVVSAIGYGFIVFGELIPKRIGLHWPERIAVIVAPGLQAFAYIASPVIAVLTRSTDFILTILQIKTPQESTVSEEEVKMLVREGARVGVFEIAEKNIVERTLLLGDKKVDQLMTPRKEIIMLKRDTPIKTLVHTVRNHPHSYFPVVEKNLDSILGVIRTKTFLANLIDDQNKALKRSLQKPLVIPEHMFALKALEMFKKTEMHMAIIVDEYGEIQGLISLTDILEAIVGDIPSDTESEEQDIVEREDGSWLVNGLVTIDEFKEFFGLSKIRDSRISDVHTIGGFVINQLGKVPSTGDHFSWNDYTFEVVDMDGNRVDKVLLSKQGKRKNTPSS